MKTWEVEVELRVRKTLLLDAPDQETAHDRVPLILSNTANWSAFLKWNDGLRGHRPMPVETIIDNDPVVASIKEVTE